MKYTQKDLTEIFNQYKTKIYNLALKISRNTEESKDILQNTFLKVIKNLDKFRYESSLSTWIYRIAINEAYMKWRTKKSQERIKNLKKEKSLLGPPPFEIPDKLAVNEELKQEINQAIKKLALKYRVVIILRDFEDLDYLQISKILKISLQTTKTRLHRARLRLRKAISNYYEDRLSKENFNKLKISWQSCSRNIKFLDNYFQDKIARGSSKRFQKHIQDCRPCRSFIKSYKDAIAIAKCLQCEDIPAELQNKIHSFLKKR